MYLANVEASDRETRNNHWISGGLAAFDHRGVQNSVPMLARRTSVALGRSTSGGFGPSFPAKASIVRYCEILTV